MMHGHKNLKRKLVSLHLICLRRCFTHCEVTEKTNKIQLHNLLTMHGHRNLMFHTVQLLLLLLPLISLLLQEEEEEEKEEEKEEEEKS